MPRACIDCGRITHTGNRCPTHTTAYRNRQAALHQQLVDPAYTKLRKLLIAEHIAWHGLHCPGADDQNHAPHPVAHPSDLTIDHVIPRSSGHDPLDTSNWRILCRHANARKGAA